MFKLKTKSIMVAHHKYDFAFYARILGLMLDVIGSILVSVSLVSLNGHVQTLHSSEKLNEKAKKELKQESKFTMIGIIFIAIGFILIFGEEIYSSVIKSSHI